MVRALWSAASGMIAQQIAVDTISNNLANVNTTGFKTENAEFKSLLYQTLQSPTTTANGENKPINAQVGLGVRNSSITSKFTQGNAIGTEKNTDFFIEGKGFFMVRGADGQNYYTRNGNFTIARAANGMMLTNSEGYPVLDAEGQPITFDENLNVNNLIIAENGEFYYPDANGNAQPIGAKIGLAQFNNPAGLLKTSGTLYSATEASGQANIEGNAGVGQSVLHQQFLEGSNVQIVDEMVNLIVSQRAYEMNSKAIQAADSMLGQANQLRG